MEQGALDIIDYVSFEKKELVISFRDLGMVVIDNYKHRFATDVLDLEKGKDYETYDIVEHMLKDEDILSKLGIEKSDVKYKYGVFGNSSKLVVQVDAPISSSKAIKDTFGINIDRRKSLFKQGSYKQMARWRFGVPGTKVTLDETIRNEIQKKGIIRINGFDSENESQNFYIKNGILNAEEIRNQKWGIIDIEIPLYEKENAEISWVGISYMGGGKVYKREMHTLRDVGNKKRVHQFEMHAADSQQDLLNNVADSINRENPFFVTAYHAPFDLGKLREKAEDIGTLFKIKRHHPLYEVATKFAKRMRLDRIEVIDPLSIEKTAHKYLHDRKLETIANYTLGEKTFTKSLDYEELKVLEELAIHASNMNLAQKSALRIASYTGGDIKVLEKLYTKFTSSEDSLSKTEGSEWLRNFLGFFKNIFSSDKKTFTTAYSFEDISTIANLFNLELMRVTHSPNSLLDFHQRKYYEETGTHYDIGLFYMKKVKKDSVTGDSIKEKATRSTKAKDKLQSVIKNLFYSGIESSVEGTYENVTKLYIPFADFVAPLFFKKYPELNEFMHYKFKKDDEGNYLYLHDTERQFFMSQYVESFLLPVIVDYYQICQKEKDLLGPFHRKNISVGEMDNIVKEFASIVSKYGETKWGSTNLRSGKLKNIRKYLNEKEVPEARKINTFKKEKNIRSNSDFLKLVYHYNFKYKNHKNQLKLPKYVFESKYGVSYESLCTRLEQKIEEVKKLVHEQGATILNNRCNGSKFFYVQNLENPLEAKLLPLLAGKVEISDNNFCFIENK